MYSNSNKIQYNSNKITSIDMSTINQKSVTDIEEISNFYFCIVGANIASSITGSPVDYKSFMIGNYR